MTQSRDIDFEQNLSSSLHGNNLLESTRPEDKPIISTASHGIEFEEQPSSGPEGNNLLESAQQEDNLIGHTRSIKDEPGSFSHLEDLDQNDLREKKWRAFRTKREVVLCACFVTALIICITNLTLASIGWSRYKRTQDGVMILYSGDCDVVRRADTGLHFLINLLSMLLFGVSNMAMQLLVAPTRKEVDKAHGKASWVDIGVPSFRNLRQISRPNCIIWCCLALSSIPIHFLLAFRALIIA